MLTNRRLLTRTTHDIIPQAKILQYTSYHKYHKTFFHLRYFVIIVSLLPGLVPLHSAVTPTARATRRPSSSSGAAPGYGRRRTLRPRPRSTAGGVVFSMLTNRRLLTRTTHDIIPQAKILQYTSYHKYHKTFFHLRYFVIIVSLLPGLVPLHSAHRNDDSRKSLLFYPKVVSFLWQFCICS